MMSVVPADLFAGIDDTPDVSTDDTPADDSPADDGIDVPDSIGDEPTEEPAVEEPAEEPVAAAADETKPPATDEDLPEGVRKGKDRKGKEGYFLEQNRYETFHGNHKLVQQATELIGEPLTTEAVKLHHDAYLGQERLFTNLNSGDPAAQTDVVRYLIQEMHGAREAGETGVDPTIPFAASVYETLRENSPDGYANLRLLAARDFIGEMFETAARSNNGSLFSSAQHFAATVAGIGPKPPEMTPEQYVAHVREVTGRMKIPFHTPAEMQSLGKREDPAVALARENAQLRSQLNGRTTTSSAAQFDTWSKANVQTVNKAVFTEVVQPALQSVEASWKKFPADYQDLVVDRLNRLVAKDVKADPALDRRLSDLSVQARRATSEQVRARVGDQIRQLIVNRAKIATEKHKPSVLKFAAESLKGRSDATHERRNGAQTRTAPQGTSAPVKRSLAPDITGFKNNVFDTSIAMKQMLQAINGR